MSFILSKPYVAKTANYTVTYYDGTIDCTSNTFAITLLSAIGLKGRQFTIKNSGAGVITINTTSSQTIDGQASGTITLSTGDSMVVESDNANWIIV